MKYLIGFLGGLAMGLISVGAAKASGNPTIGWLIGYVSGVIAMIVDRKFFRNAA